MSGRTMKLAKNDAAKRKTITHSTTHDITTKRNFPVPVMPSPHATVEAAVLNTALYACPMEVIAPAPLGGASGRRMQPAGNVRSATLLVLVSAGAMSLAA